MLLESEPLRDRLASCDASVSYRLLCATTSYCQNHDRKANHEENLVSLFPSIIFRQNLPLSAEVWQNSTTDFSDNTRPTIYLLTRTLSISYVERLLLWCA
jgi:hypothetical protein